MTTQQHKDSMTQAEHYSNYISVSDHPLMAVDELLNPEGAYHDQTNGMMAKYAGDHTAIVLVRMTDDSALLIACVEEHDTVYVDNRAYADPAEGSLNYLTNARRLGAPLTEREQLILSLGEKLVEAETTHV